MKGYKEVILPFFYLMIIITFFFDYVQIKIINTNFLLSGFDLFSNSNVINGDPILNIWIVLSFSTAIMGLVVAIVVKKNKYGIEFLLALAGLIFLIVAQFYTINTYEEKSHGLAIISFEPTYWLCCILFAGIGSRCYLNQYKNGTNKIIEQRNGTVNINIITQQSDAAENK